MLRNSEPFAIITLISVVWNPLRKPTISLPFVSGHALHTSLTGERTASKLRYSFAVKFYKNLIYFLQFSLRLILIHQINHTHRHTRQQFLSIKYIWRSLSFALGLITVIRKPFYYCSMP